MTIKEWLLEDKIKNYIIRIEKLKELEAPQLIIQDAIKKLDNFKKGKLTGISSKDKYTGEDLFEVEIKSIKEVTKPRGKNEFLLFNENIWLLPGNGFSYLRKEANDYKLVKILL